MKLKLHFDLRFYEVKTWFMKFILGKKIEMLQVFDEKGNIIPITLIEAGPCLVTQIKTKEKDKYEAVQLGFKKIEKKKKIKKSGQKKPFFWLREFVSSSPSLRLPEGEEETTSLRLGDEVNVSALKEGDKVKVSGISKGKGFQGGVKRWGFQGSASASHGARHEHRTLGSVGSRFPQRVVKGKKMPGRMGRKRVTVKNLEIIRIDKENNLLAVKGAVPGARGTLLEIRN